MAYTVEGLEAGIKHCRKNIAVFECAIEKERNTIKEWRIMQDSIEESDRKVKEANANVHIEVVTDGGA